MDTNLTARESTAIVLLFLAVGGLPQHQAVITPEPTVPQNIPVTKGNTSPAGLFSQNLNQNHTEPTHEPGGHIYPTVYPKPEDRLNHVPLDCEKMSKDAQAKYGGDLIFLVGKDERGQYINGAYAGHFLNYIYVKEHGKKEYIDYQTGRVYEDPLEVLLDFKEYKGYPDAELFNLAERSFPGGMTWHY